VSNCAARWQRAKCLRRLVFFIFGGRPLIRLLPIWVQYTYDLGLVLLSTLWLYKTWRRSPDLYSRKNLANRFRKQPEKLQFNVSQFLDGFSLKTNL